jgi:orotidine-5'-phosphate decarboxylase
MRELKDRIIVALDLDNLDKAIELVVKLVPAGVKIFKVGSQLFTAYGPQAVSRVTEKGARVFLDLKFHDIPNTVYSAVATGTASGTTASMARTAGNVKDNITSPVFMMTVHTKGGLAMLKAAAKAAQEKAGELKITKPFIVGVTRLTSDEDSGNIKDEVLQASRLAKDAGLDGVVCAVSEAAVVRKEFGRDFIIVTPGIRPKGYAVHDQSRVATAQEAVKEGADYFVIGRPVLEAKDPVAILKEILIG